MPDATCLNCVRRQRALTQPGVLLRRLCLPFLVLALWATPAAFAAPPPLSDEGAVTEPGDCEWQIGTQRSRSSQPNKRETGAQLTCGVGWRTELGVSGAAERAGQQRERQAALEGTTVLVDRQGRAWGLALNYGAVWQREPPQSWRHRTWLAQLESSWFFAPDWIFEAGIGTERERTKRRDRSPWVLALEHRLALDIDLRIERAGSSGAGAAWTASIRLPLPHWDARVELERTAPHGAERQRSTGIKLIVEL